MHADVGVLAFGAPPWHQTTPFAQLNCYTIANTIPGLAMTG